MTIGVVIGLITPSKIETPPLQPIIVRALNKEFTAHSVLIKLPSRTPTEHRVSVHKKRLTKSVTNTYEEVINLTPFPELDLPVKVTGLVYARTGDIIDGETIKLFSASLGKAYSVKTALNKYFEFTVLPASDYVLSVDPRGMFQRYRQQNLTLRGEQAPLMITLEPLPSSVLYGQVNNRQGQAISGLNLKLRSETKSRWEQFIKTNSIGKFVVNDVPHGGLFFSTTIDQILLSAGHQFIDNGSSEMTLVLDAGPFVVSGTIFDSFNDPVPGANVIVSWENNVGEVHTSSYRRTTTLGDGTFTIKGLGMGEHKLVISDNSTGASHRQSLDLDSYFTDLTVVLSKNLLIQ